MKAVQVMFDERLLKQLDATSEVRREGRSAVLRRLVEEHLKRRRSFAVSEGYRRAYGSQDGPVDGLGGEFPGWDDEGTWPKD